MKEGRYYFELLTDEEKKNFIEAVNECKTNVFTFDELMILKHLSFKNLISIAFTWRKTKQGRDYWYRISISNRENI